jgi:hypothetical protein
MSWYVKLMIIDGSERIIWSMWIMLSWIGSLGLDKNQPHCPTVEPKSSLAPAISPTNILLIYSIMSWYVKMMIIDASPYGIIWSTWIMLGWIGR